VKKTSKKNAKTHMPETKDH